jgi:ABC-type bacteriocin/lantibiotic exporter with double-glycine peptidase domain
MNIKPNLMPVTDNRETPPGSRGGMLKLLGWIWRLSKSNAPLLMLAMLCAAAISSFSALTLYFARQFIDVAVKNPAPSALFYPVGIMVALLLGSTLLKLIGRTFEALAFTGIRSDLETACFRHLSTLDYEYLAGHSANRLTAAIMGEIPIASTVMGVIIRSFIRAPLTVLFLSGVLLFQIRNPLVLLLVLPLFLLLSVRVFTRRIKRAANAAFEHLSQMYGELNAQLTGVRTVISLGIIRWFSERLARHAVATARESRKSTLFHSLQQSIKEAVSILFLIGLLFSIAWLVSHEYVTLSQAFLIPATLWFCRDEVLRISEGYIQLQKTEGAIRRLLDFLDAPSMKDGGTDLEGPIVSVRFCGVSFRHPGSETLLEGVDLELTRGLTVITGHSGSGKSTLCDLCLRIKTPSAGTICFNGVPLEDLRDRYLRRETALVEQEPFLFEETLRFNLCIGQEPFEEDVLYEALASVQADAFVREMPAQLESRLMRNASNLSVGQKQRIAVARALLRRPSLLVLDEFTSGLDEETERQILETVKRLSEEMIVLCTTHRASVVEQADRVYRIIDKRLVRIDPPAVSQGSECYERPSGIP